MKMTDYSAMSDHELEREIDLLLTEIAAANRDLAEARVAQQKLRAGAR